MKCTDIERLLIDSSPEELSEEKLSELKGHVSQCARCQRFKDDLEKIRVHLREMSAPAPSAELIRRTQLLCHDKLESQAVSQARIKRQTTPSSIPWVIWAAFLCLLLLTTIWMFPLVKDIASNQALSLKSLAVLVLIIQNALVLCFTPILLRRCRWKGEGLRLA